MAKRQPALARMFLLLVTFYGSVACSLTRQEDLIRITVVGVRSGLKDADLKATAQTRDLVERALFRRGGFLIDQEFGRAASYKTLKELIAAPDVKFITSRVGPMIAVSRERTPKMDVIEFHVFGGPSPARYDVFSVEARNLNAGIQKVAQLASGYGHIVFDVSTLPPRTDIYVDDQLFQTTDDKGRFRETFTWPAREYSIKFVAWVADRRREAQEIARVTAKQILHFKKDINLED